MKMIIDIKALAQKDPLSLLDGTEDVYKAESAYLGACEEITGQALNERGLTLSGTQFSEDGALTFYISRDRKELTKVSSNLNDANAATCFEVEAAQQIVTSVRDAFIKRNKELETFVSSV